MSHLIIDTAKAIIPHLPELLGEHAESVNTQLQVLLVKHKDGEQVETEIIDLLGKHEPARQWMNKKLSFAEEIATRGVGTLSFSELAGNRGEVKGAKYYKCPQAGCDYRWTKALDWSIPPKCPDHNCDLIEDD